jgi:hypothetical protein
MDTGYFSLHPKREPVAWITVAIIVLQIIVGLLTHNLDTSLYSSLLTALGGAGIRQNVWSPASHNAAVNHVVQSMATAIVKKPSGRKTKMVENDEEYVIPNPKEFPDGDQFDSTMEDVKQGVSNG